MGWSNLAVLAGVKYRGKVQPVAIFTLNVMKMNVIFRWRQVRDMFTMR